MLLERLTILCIIKLSLASNVFASDHGDVSQTLEIIRARGFAGEEFHIKSYDGYPLTVYHVINPFADQKTLNKFPVVIFHGLGGDATQMISHSIGAKARKPVLGQLTAFKFDDDCMAFMLSNNNYDVWLIDARGVNLNNRNVTVDTNFVESQQFWKYTLDEGALKDSPRLIDFVLEQTRTPKALVVTYSESTFFLFALLSAVPDYVDRIAALVALAPTVYVENLRGLALAWMIPFSITPEIIDGNYAPQPIVDTLGMTVRRLCSTQLISTLVCRQVSQAVAGKQDSNAEAGDFFSTLAKGSSIRVFKHFVQLNQQKRFGMYDYGPRVNLLKYGTAAAPNYDLGKVRLSTIILVRGDNDFLSTELDQERLIRELGVKPILDIKLPKYNHLDFILHENVTRDINFPVVRAFNQVLLNDISSPGILIRDPSMPIPPKTQEPQMSVLPRGEPGKIINAPVHTLRNVVDSLEIKPKLSLIMPSEQRGQVLDSINNFVENADRFAGSLNRIPDLIQARMQFAF